LKKVSVICLCYNQAPYLEEALKSVWAQSYPNVEVIVVDDASTDNSAEVIKSLLKGKPEVPFIQHEENQGNCRSFNRGLQLATGNYVIDFALDDVMHPDRIARQVSFFESLPADYGVIYHNALYVDQKGKDLHTHFQSDFSAPEGDIYSRLISTYFIPPPTMMFKKQVIDEMDGYDESLSYEDFDFWVRSSRNYKYGYQPELLTSIRKHATSLSTRWYKPGDKQLHSTYLVCLKIQQINKSDDENASLVKRLKYEIRQSVFSANYVEAALFINLLKSYQVLPLQYKLLETLNSCKIDLRWIRNAYHWLRSHLFPPKSHFK
jgi:glycosyltransferase involved in cell wall biosynthesis